MASWARRHGDGASGRAPRRGEMLPSATFLFPWPSRPLRFYRGAEGIAHAHTGGCRCGQTHCIRRAFIDRNVLCFTVFLRCLGRVCIAAHLLAEAAVIGCLVAVHRHFGAAVGKANRGKALHSNTLARVGKRFIAASWRARGGGPVRLGSVVQWTSRHRDVFFAITVTSGS